MESKLKQVRLLVSGRVQGVAFRWWVVRAAQELRLTGWVKNLDDGRVEIVAEGKKQKLTKLNELIKESGGPTFAKVKNVDADWGKATGDFEDFEIQD